MIRYSLKCAEAHSFDSWFQSADAFDRLRERGHLTCAVCGSASVEKAIMAPRVTTSEREGTVTETAKTPQKPLSTPQSPAEQALAALRRHVETHSDYVGQSFATEARAMHDGAAPARPIWGEARADEARALIEDGVPLMPLPFGPRSKSN